MFLVEASAVLPFAPEAVLAAAGSVESAVCWQVGVRGVRRARRGRGPGALVLQYHALGVRHALVARVTRWGPPRHFAYRAWGSAFALDVSLEAVAAPGGTRVVYRLRLATTPPPAGDAEGRSGLGPAEAAALRRLVDRRAPRDLARLEAYVARRGAR